MARGVHTACAADNAHRYENTHCFSFVVVVAQAGVVHTNGNGIFSLVYDVSPAFSSHCCSQCPYYTYVVVLLLHRAPIVH